MALCDFKGAMCGDPNEGAAASQSASQIKHSVWSLPLMMGKRQMRNPNGNHYTTPFPLPSQITSFLQHCAFLLENHTDSHFPHTCHNSLAPFTLITHIATWMVVPLAVHQTLGTVGRVRGHERF